jgi:Leucine-rich repeat (LRR) protein
MKALVRCALSAVLAFALLGIGGTPVQAADPPVSVPDPVLRTCIQKALTAQGLPTDLDADNLAALESVACLAADGVISDLTGVEHLVGIAMLAVYGSDVTDVRPVTGLPALWYLRVDSTQSYDLAPVESLPSLTTLRVTLQEGTDATPLGRLNGLVKLQVKTDLSRLPKLTTPSTVGELAILGDNLVSLGQVVGGSAVSVLAVRAKKLTSLDGVEGLVGVEDLSCPGALLSDISTVASMTRLRVLDLRENQIGDLSPLENLSRLQTVKLDRNQISSITALSAGRAIDTLYLDNNQLTDLSPLAGLPSLSRLSASENHLVSLGPVGGLAALVHGNFRANRLASIGALKGAPLETIDLSNNQISDLRPLSDVPPTAYVQLEGNQVKDLSPLPDEAPWISAGSQTPSFAGTATVGVPLDLGIRDAAGHPVCPIFTPSATCTAGAVTYANPGTYHGELTGGPQGISLAFAQHAGPDRAFASTPAPTIDKDIYPGMSVGLRIPDWSPKADHFTYEWFRDGVAVPGEAPNYPDFVTTVADLGHRISVCVTGHLDGVIDTRKCSNTAIVVEGRVLGPVYPPLVGVATTDSVLNVDSRFWQAGAILKYQWKRDHKSIRGATAPTYRVRARDVGHSIRAIITGTMTGYRPVTVNSHSVRPKKAQFSAPVPVVTGGLAVGKRLTVTPGVWAPATAHLSYRWYRNGTAISHATKATYLLKARDRGKAIKVRVTAQRDGYITKRVYSVPTAAVT